MSRGSPRRRRFVFGAVVIVAVMAWLIFSNVLGSSTPYQAVSEVKAAGPSDRLVRAVGNARDIVWDEQSMLLRFFVSDGQESLPVAYRGVRPDLLVEDARTVVEGQLTEAGVLEASKVLLQCPSKYVEE